MAERVFVAGALEILKKLSSFTEEEIILIWSVKKEFKKLKETFPLLLAVLRDAEMRQEKDELIRLWLERLKDVAYEADDVVDEFSFEAIRRRMKIQNSKMKKVCDVISPKIPIASRFRMARKMKDIKEKIDEIEKDMKMFNFKVGDVNGHFQNDLDRETDARLDNSLIFGREKEKSMLIDMLIGSSNEESISVIPIVGIGGLGKTTLAKIVYNDESVIAHFDERMWICVSDNFKVSKLIKEMVESLTRTKPILSNLEAIQCRLADYLKGKKFLLVLDDVWNPNHEKWERLRASLLIGAKGSKIVVTTRNEKVALMMGTLPPHHLGGLSENESWSLFKIRAFGSGGASENSNTVRIGKGLVEKCKGVPLAIKSLSALMHSKRNEHEWLSIQDNEIWNESEDGNGILSVLKLSYDYLSPPLKQCFAYCSVFPKDYQIHKKTLIQLWMAEGLLQSSNGNKLMEDIGDEYFKSLVWNSFFQDVERDMFGEEVTCKMHDLVHDLAQSINGNECMIVEDFDKIKPKMETRYLSLVGDTETIPKTFYTMKKVREHLCLGRDYLSPPYRLSGDMFLNFRSLRVLDLNDADIRSLPSSIGELKHLRFLSANFALATFPKSITKLYNLQTLKLLNFRKPTLPKGITKLINLRHLEVEHGLGFPKGIGQLTNLQTLNCFCVKEDTEAVGIEELKDLELLGGILQLENLNWVKNATPANLRGKPRLRELHLTFTSDSSDSQHSNILGYPRVNLLENGFESDNKLLESLQPHPNLISLIISSFTGTKPPAWMNGSSYLSSLQYLKLDSCPNIVSLDLAGLCSLRLLEISYCLNLSLGLSKGLTALESISLWKFGNLMSLGMPDFINLKTLKIRHCSRLAALPDEFFSLLTSLKTLEVNECSILKTLPESLGNLSSLQELHIMGCPDFASLPENLGNLLALKKLEIFDCPDLIALTEGLGNLWSLQHLVIEYCGRLTALPESLGNLSSLQELNIRHCSGLTALPESLGNLSSLQKLKICYCSGLVALPESLGNLLALEKLKIDCCLGLVALPEGLGNLSSLQKLYIVDNHNLTGLPESSGDLSSLKKLKISGSCNLASLPERIRRLTS